MMGGWDDIALSLERGLTYFFVMLSSMGAMTLIAAAAPGFVRRERANARNGMRRCFLWGLVFVINCVLVAALLRMLDSAVGNILALVVMVGLLAVCLSGLAAVSCEVGRRVLSLANCFEPTVLASIIVGTFTLFITAVIPVFGWIVFTGALLTGIGAFLETAVGDIRPTRQISPNLAESYPTEH